MDSTHVWKVYSPAGVYLTSWQDTVRPSYSVRADGVSDLTLALPWLPGNGSQLARRRADGGNRVDLMVTTRDTVTGGGSFVLGQAVLGEARLGSALGISRIAGRWRIRQRTERPPFGVELALIPLSGVADDPLPSTLTLSGCPVQLARWIVTSYLPALTWDSGNPAVCDSEPISDAVFDGVTWRQVLESLAALSGSGWYVAYTADGRVRFRPQPTTATHRITVGHSGIVPALVYDEIERRKEIIVRWAGGETLPHRAGDWTATDPRRERVTAEHLTTEGDAHRLATLTLAARDTVDYRGSVTLVRPYPIETVQVGDGLKMEGIAPAAGGGSFILGQAVLGQVQLGGGVYGGAALAVAEVNVDELDRATVTLAQPRPDIRNEIARLNRRVETLRAQVA